MIVRTWRNPCFWFDAECCKTFLVIFKMFIGRSDTPDGQLYTELYSVYIDGSLSSQWLRKRSIYIYRIRFRIQLSIWREGKYSLALNNGGFMTITSRNAILGPFLIINNWGFSCTGNEYFHTWITVFTHAKNAKV